MSSSRRFHASVLVMLLSLVLFHRQRSFLGSIIDPDASASTTNTREATSVTSITTISKEEDKEKDTPVNESASNSNSSRQDDFLPENIGFPSKVPCGSQKCFYHLISNRQVGYLVNPETKSNRLKVLNDGWELANRLEREHGIQHFLLSPPTPVKVSKEMAKRLNHNLYIERTRKIQRGKKAHRFPKYSTVYVQKVQMAPKQHLLLGCVPSKVAAFRKDLVKFMPNVNRNHTDTFLENVSKNLKDAKTLIDREPCLVKDFQVMIDTKGRLYHLDFDRCFSSSGHVFHMPRTFTRKCMRVLDRMERYIRRDLRYKD